MAAVGRLSAAIAHEIRQPLTAMAGAVKELAPLVPLEEDEKHLVNIVSRESERLNHIITDFLNYSREKSYVFQDADVRSLLDETSAADRAGNPVSKKQFHIVKVLMEMPVKAHVDPNKIRQVFWNLCDNALRAMPAGGTLTVGIEQLQPDWLRISFRDTGIGLDPRSAPRFLSRCSRISKVGQDWGWPSCIRLCRRTMAESRSSAKRKRARNLWSNCLASN